MERINVLIITYKQERLIGRALDTILKQKEYGLQSIIISDDHSPDGTLNILRRYEKEYPDYIKVYENENNLGIYGNLNKIIHHKGDADLYYIMAGDDALEDGWFKVVQNYIANNNISTQDSVAIFSDWVNIDPKGNRVIMKRNESLLNDKRVFGLFIRNKISARSTLMSSLALSELSNVDLSLGIGNAECQFECKRMVGIKKAYYISYPATIYYSGIGVSADLTRHDPKYYTEGAIASNEFLLNNYAINKEDIDYLNGQIASAKFIISFNIFFLFKSIIKYYKGMQSYGFKWGAFFDYYKYILYLALKNLRNE